MEELELYNEIGKNIKNKRKELGITQEELAKLTNLFLLLLTLKVSHFNLFLSQL